MGSQLHPALCRVSASGCGSHRSQRWNPARPHNHFILHPLPCPTFIPEVGTWTSGCLLFELRAHDKAWQILTPVPRCVPGTGPGLSQATSAVLICTHTGGKGIARLG